MAKLPKNFEAYARYEYQSISKTTEVVIERGEFKQIVEAAGIYLHRPDKKTGVVVIHRYKDRSDPRQYSKTELKRAERARRELRKKR
jgi:hypothetical protein